MNEPITIFDPSAAPAAESLGFAVNWPGLAVAAGVLLFTAFLLHRFLRRRLRASALDLASEALVRRLGLGRGARRGLRTLARHADQPMGVLLLNRGALAMTAARLVATGPKSGERAGVERLMKRLGGDEFRKTG